MQIKILICGAEEPMAAKPKTLTPHCLFLSTV